MAETALEALYTAVKRRLTENAELWGDRVSPDVAPSSTERPHVVYAWAGGGEVNGLVKPDAVIVLTVQCYAETQAQAFAASARISVLLNDADGSSDRALEGGADWDILNTQQEGIIHIVETVDSTWVYREGHRFRISMEHK